MDVHRGPDPPVDGTNHLVIMKDEDDSSEPNISRIMFSCRNENLKLSGQRFWVCTRTNPVGDRHEWTAVNGEKALIPECHPDTSILKDMSTKGQRQHKDCQTPRLQTPESPKTDGKVSVTVVEKGGNKIANFGCDTESGFELKGQRSWLCTKMNGWQGHFGEQDALVPECVRKPPAMGNRREEKHRKY